MGHLTLTKFGEKKLKILGLTVAEIDLIRKFLNHASNKDIADSLFVCEKTVKFHLTNIYRKLQQANRNELRIFLFQYCHFWEEPMEGEPEVSLPTYAEDEIPSLPRGIVDSST